MKTAAPALVALLAAFISPLGLAQEEKAASPELAALKHFVGTWDLEFTMINPGQEPFEAEAVSYRKMSKGGEVLLFDDPSDGGEVHLSLAYDPASKKYRGVILLGVETGTVEGTWDAGSKTMRFEIEYTNGYIYKGEHQFKRDGYAEAGGKVFDAEGKLAHTVSWKQTRRAKD